MKRSYAGWGRRRNPACPRFSARPRATHHLLPGLTDRKSFEHRSRTPWHSNQGSVVRGEGKPEVLSFREPVGLDCGIRLRGSIGRAELLANKRAAGRPKDLLDADLLERTSER